MAVRKRIVDPIDAFIEKGSDFKEKRRKAFKNVLVRIPSGILSDLDQAVENRPWINRTQWIVEAIHEKIARECGVKSGSAGISQAGG